LYLYYSNGSPRPVVVGLGTALIVVIAPADASVYALRDLRGFMKDGWDF
jgi:hypothetical protein